MPQGAPFKTASRHSRFYYLKSADLATLPANLAAASAIAVPANLFTRTTGDPTLPAVTGTDEDTPPIRVRTHGANAEDYSDDITPAPTTASRNFPIDWYCDFTNTLHRAIREAARGTFATLIVDWQWAAGNGTRGIVAGSAQGTLCCYTVTHGDAPITPPSSATYLRGTTNFRVVDDAAGAVGRKFYDYGQP